MIASSWVPEPDYSLQMGRSRGEVLAVSRRVQLRMLIDKADRQNELWVIADRWFGGPIRWLATLATGKTTRSLSPEK
jgi:ribosomal protein S2